MESIVLLEKPVAMNQEQLFGILALSNSKELFFSTNFGIRLIPAFKHLGTRLLEAEQDIGHVHFWTGLERSVESCLELKLKGEFKINWAVNYSSSVTVCMETVEGVAVRSLQNVWKCVYTPRLVRKEVKIADEIRRQIGVVWDFLKPNSKIQDEGEKGGGHGCDHKVNFHSAQLWRLHYCRCWASRWESVSEL
jgi:hypothetical protein